MASRSTYRDWKARTQKASTILADKQLPTWKKAHMVGGAYNGLELDQLLPKHKRRIYASLSDMNQILRKYEIKTWDDYEQIEEVDLRQIIQIAKGLACPRSNP